MDFQTDVMSPNIFILTFNLTVDIAAQGISSNKAVAAMEIVVSSNK